MSVVLDDVVEPMLPAGEYDNYSDPHVKAKFTLNDDYYPVVFTLSQTAPTAQVVATGTLADIRGALDAYTAAAEYEPNTDLAASFELTWAWNFENSADIDDIDRADTYLGDVAAGIIVDNNAVTELSYALEIIVVQVD